MLIFDVQFRGPELNRTIHVGFIPFRGSGPKFPNSCPYLMVLGSKPKGTNPKGTKESSLMSKPTWLGGLQKP